MDNFRCCARFLSHDSLQDFGGDRSNLDFLSFDLRGDQCLHPPGSVEIRAVGVAILVQVLFWYYDVLVLVGYVDNNGGWRSYYHWSAALGTSTESTARFLCDVAPVEITDLVAGAAATSCATGGRA